MAKVTVKLFESTLGKTLRAAIYIGVSAALTWLIGELTKQHDSFGMYYPIVNIVLVALKNLLDRQVKNLPDSYKLR